MARSAGNVLTFNTKLGKIKFQMARSAEHVWHDLVQKIVSLTNTRENREEIHKKQGKCP